MKNRKLFLALSNVTGFAFVILFIAWFVGDISGWYSITALLLSIFFEELA